MILNLAIQYAQNIMQHIDIGQCYTRTSSLTLDKDQRILILQLIPTFNTNCTLLNGDIQVHLKLQQNAIPYTLSISAIQFSYNKTQDIIFYIPQKYDITNYNNEQFAVISINNLLYITQMQVFIFDELKTDIRQCFEQIEIIIIGNLTTFNMCPNIKCINQLVLSNNNKQQYVEKISVSIDKFTYNLSTQEIINKYQEQKCYSEKIFINNQDRQQILLESFIVSKVNILFSSEEQSFQLVYPVLTNIDNISNIFTSKLTYLYAYESDYGYEMIFEYNQTLENEAINIVDNLQYDYVQYRLTESIKSNLGVYKQFITKTESKFNKSQRSIKFSCGQMKGEQLKTCNEMYYNDYFTYYANTTYNLDIMFYHQNQLVYLIKAYNCRPRYTCWNYGVAVFSNSQLTLQLSRNNYCDNYNEYYDTSNIPTKIKIYNKYYELEQEIQQNISDATDRNQFNISCKLIDCSKLNQDSIIYLEMYVSYFYESFYITKVSDLRYKLSVTQYSGIIIGAILLFIIFIVAVRQCFKSYLTIQNYQYFGTQHRQQQQQYHNNRQQIFGEM
ncbi:Conserved_hypothetical protein [Hexamita inflata]|uniref:Transmembrane protein n=1 Tax=Hexamita inflata TaxID=28002 RepID=A0ABP1J4I4_9EUKA